MKFVFNTLVAIAMTLSTNTFAAEPISPAARMPHAVEVATFKLKPDVTDSQLLALEARIRMGAISKQPGYISRELGKDEASGVWLMVMRFDTRKNMDAWLANLKTVPEMKEMAGLLDMSSMQMAFYQSLL
jgi:antibiotic biosynthesis monooxygenase (ABM) superfamily enzyme